MNLLDSLVAPHDLAMPIVDAHHHLWDLDRSENGLAIWRKGLAALADCPNVAIKISEPSPPGAHHDAGKMGRVTAPF